MYSHMYVPNVSPLTESERALVEQNLNLVWEVYHHEKTKLPHNSQYSAEDLFQIGCLGLIKAVKTYDNTRAELSTWATRVILHQFKALCVYHKRRHSNYILFDDNDEKTRQDYLEFKTQPLSEGDTFADTLHLKQALKQIKFNDREKMVLQLMWDGLTSSAIAERLGLPIYTVSRIKRSIKDKIVSSLHPSWETTAVM